MNKLPKWALHIGRVGAYSNIPGTSISQTLAQFLRSFQHAFLEISKTNLLPLLSDEISSSICHVLAINSTSPSTPESTYSDFLLQGKKSLSSFDKVICLIDAHPLSRALFLKLITFSLESLISNYLLDHFYQQICMLNIISLSKNQKKFFLYSGPSQGPHHFLSTSYQKKNYTEEVSFKTASIYYLEMLSKK